ncbi:hypothetical protein PV08_09948 [Exophiala spinifera]|uniref:GH16 domain-containing protein n=1 Tax=Exophiala spinifera TaxID=91928 RepID=A0A0D2B239_9EURO|nr:uncharacterized protein PV08_09948 [Exophiala spinifera]KIW12670.1 hypothetical protein PV08_09948 [Exophiala spinifera]
MVSLSVALIALLSLQSRASQLPERRSPLFPRASSPSSSKCDLYVVSGQDTTKFEHYTFSDFRALSNYSINEPPSVTAEEDQGQENITSPYFAQPPFSDQWEIRRGIRNAESTVPMIYSASNVYITKDPGSGGSETYLTLRTTRLQDFQSVVQLVSVPDLLHASMRTRMKILPDGKDGKNVARGAVVGFFTYESDTQESDIEILTRDPLDTVQLTNQPASSTTPGASFDSTIPHGKHWTDWTEYRIDWFPGRTLWYLDGKMVFNTTDSVPTDPSNLMFNLWSNGQSFSGTMRVGREVYVAVQWIEMAYNLNGQGQSSNQTDGKTQCSVDSVHTKGVPEVIKSSSAKHRAVSRLLDTINSVLFVLIACYCV